MGRRAKSIKLSVEQRAELELGYKQGSPPFSKRCHMVLLKSEGLISKDVSKFLMINQVTINKWLMRYIEKGLAGLKTQPGQGRKPILDEKTDKAKVKAAVKKERQRLKHAKEELEKELGKEFSLKTLKRFLKNLSADGNASV